MSLSPPTLICCVIAPLREQPFDPALLDLRMNRAGARFTNLAVYVTNSAHGLFVRHALTKPKILSTRPLFPAARAVLDQHFEVDYWTPSERITREELLKRVDDKEGLVCLLTEKVDEELLGRAPKLRIAATVSVGYDNIDVAACTRRKVVATHTPGVLDHTTADFAWTLLMAIARRLLEGDAWMRSGTWPGWDLDQLVGGDVWGKTLGVLGFGRIGRGVARRALGFEMKVLYSDAVRAPEEVERELHAEYVDRDRLFRESDFISLHVPLLPDTRHLISHENLDKMKRTAFLVNTSRGPVVDEAALAEALENRKIAGAALDVYEHEPLVHPALLSRRDVILAPHIASASLDTRTKMAVMAANNVVAIFEGRRPPNALNADALGLN
jgi:lactate dehydrogenase-like 2-hydroxyacid dehydrogenase